MRLTLTQKYVGSLLAAVFVCCAVTLGIVVHIMSQPLDNNFENNVVRMQRLIHRVITNFTYVRFLHHAEILAHNEELSNAVLRNDRELAALLIRRSMRDAGSDFVTVTDHKGTVIARAHSSRHGDSLLGQKTVARALEGAPEVGVVSGVEVPFSIRASSPLLVDGGELLVGTLSLGVSLATSVFPDRLKHLSGAEIVIYKDDVSIMSTLEKDGVRLTGDKLSCPVIRKAVFEHGETCFTDYELHGTLYRVVCWPMRDADASIVGMWMAGLPVSVVTEPKQKAVLTAVCASVVLMAVLVLFFVAVGLRISAPMREITRYVLDVADGKKEGTLTVNSADDMGDLARALRDMVGILQSRADDFYALASRDPLTDLWNRRRFTEEALREIALSLRYGHPFCLAMADIDHFKKINDTHGHAAGDVVLREVADLLRRNLRSSDILARFGGEEFVFLLPQTTVEKGGSVFEKLRGLCSTATVNALGNEIRVTLSFGVSAYDPAGERGLPERLLDDLVRRADAALYVSKEQGRNRVTVDDAGTVPDSSEHMTF